MRLFRSVTLLCLLLVPGQAALADVRTDRLRADWAALQEASRDFLQRSASLSPEETSDYRAYIERLRRRLADSCAALLTAGLAVPPEVACPQVILRIAPANIDQHAEQTRTEATSTLDAELNADLGEFDQRLLREQERVKAKASGPAGRSGTGAAGAAGASGEGGAESGTSSGSRSAVERTGADAGLERPAETAGAGKGQKSASPPPPPPPDTPDGRDDDVVARQLREAAEQETDPELRKKLWDEYRRYKQGVR